MVKQLHLTQFIREIRIQKDQRTEAPAVIGTCMSNIIICAVKTVAREMLSVSGQSTVPMLTCTGSTEVR
jgi:hypothetical protein